MSKEIKRKADPGLWNEYLIYSKIIDLFVAWVKLRGSGSINMDIRIFTDCIASKLISIYGEENENG